MRQSAAILLLLLVAGSQATAAGKPAPACQDLALLPPDASDEDKRISCEIPGPFRRQVLESEARAYRIRMHDLAAWLSTDALREQQAFEKIPGVPAGWLTREVTSGIDIRYFTSIEGRQHAFAEAHLDIGKLKISSSRRLAEPEPATEDELRLLRARATAMAAQRLQCTRALNTVILEEPGFREIRVYLFSGWDETAAPLGGHSRFLISPDGGTVVEAFQQTRSCLNYPSRMDPKQMLLVSDLHSGPPSELQVFLQRQYEVPLVVRMMGDDSTWKIEDGLIHALGEGDPLLKSVREQESKMDADAAGAENENDKDSREDKP
jgi:hypothetical protein